MTAVDEQFIIAELLALKGAVTGASRSALTVEQLRFLSPIAEPSNEALEVAASNLSKCIAACAMPSYSNVGLLTDDPKLLQHVNDAGNMWLDDFRLQQSNSESQYRTHLQRLFDATAFSDSFSSPSSLAITTLTGDVDAALAALKQQPMLTCRLVAARILFNFRITIGTVTAIGLLGFSLPPTDLLLACFQKPHCPPREVIHVGARALAKHVHRDNSLSWWGNHHLTGTQAKKNAAADAVLSRILSGSGSSCGWRNFHVLPHGFVVYEVRVPEGYGARWQLDTNQLTSADTPLSPDAFTFRGFLEPHDLQGHANAWQH
eukprot:GILI01014818.1.p1 GENE.GILI01014818.1~~GILI01014818.1.p1  ORF type:complete len:329 (+),score=18.30 GILI01014818.1:35-988(+)